MKLFIDTKNLIFEEYEDGENTEFKNVDTLGIYYHEKFNVKITTNEITQEILKIEVIENGGTKI